MKKYTLGFIFDQTRENVLLIHKGKPEWQAGRVNGIGGKIEEGESELTCISRETKEEACLIVPEESWIYLGMISTDNWNLQAFAAVYEGDPDDAKQGDHEKVEWFPTSALPLNCIQNLTWIIPFAREKMETSTDGTFNVKYINDIAEK